MQKDSRLFDDMARMMSGATNMAFDMRRELESMMAQQMEAFLGKTSLVTRDEFEAVKAMAVKAREENAVLKAELERLKNDGDDTAEPAPKKTALSDSE